MSGFLVGLGVSTVAIFFAEMGDKTQLVAMSLATRYRVLTVVLGITAATAVVHLGSVFIAEVLGAAIPTDWLTLAAGLAFLFFGAWTLRGDEMNDKDEERAASRRLRSGFMTVALVFFVAELGDKTMLATITVGTQHHWFPVWIGATAGMVAADAVAIALGALLGTPRPEVRIPVVAAIVVCVAGAALLAQAAVALLPRSATGPEGAAAPRGRPHRGSQVSHVSVPPRSSLFSD